MCVCCLMNEFSDEKLIDCFDNVVFDGFNVDIYFNDCVCCCDIFMSMIMIMIWEFVFMWYFFGMDCE